MHIFNASFSILDLVRHGTTGNRNKNILDPTHHSRYIKAVKKRFPVTHLDYLRALNVDPIALISPEKMKKS
jgi:hypothetical protein